MLDIIGKAGFGYTFYVLLPPGSGPHVADVAETSSCFPVLRQFCPNTRAMQEARDKMHHIGTQLISECKAKHADAKPAPATHNILSILRPCPHPALPQANQSPAVCANAATSPAHVLSHTDWLTQRGGTPQWWFSSTLLSFIDPKTCIDKP
ncbi:hypothetical protein BC834DRAFT_974906 [Gloeopeniophorella convolvens]|nr:hypothetical protein BC834DRAFT_974906 [Gloeopeniophorella convolvens]